MAGKRYGTTPLQRLTLKQLTQATAAAFPDIVKRSMKQCHVIKQEYGVGSNDGFQPSPAGRDPVYYNEMRVYMACNTGKRVSFIRFFGPPDPNVPVWAWCSCPYFTFNLEVALTRRNSSSIKFSNGQMPRERNRLLVPHLCKHLILTAKLGVMQTDDLAAKKLEMASEEKTAAMKQQAMKLASGKGKVIPPHQFTAPRGGKGMIDIP